MTITPTGALPSLFIAGPGEDASTGTTTGPADDFLAAILQALGVGATAPDVTTPAGQAGNAPDDTAAAAGTVAQAALTLPPPAPAGPPPGPPMPGLPVPGLPTAGAPVPADPAAVEAADSAVDATSGVALAQAGPVLPEVVTPTPDTGPASHKAIPATSVPAAAHPGVPDDAQQVADTGRPNTPAPAPDAAPEPQLPALTAVATAGATGTAAVASGDAPDPVAGSVRSQVFTEVTSLVSRGDGTHRVTMTLTPESLGEVRVVMSMHAGVVRVHLTASDGDAKAALAHGSPELVRLLELAGASDTKIVVRDLSQGSTSMNGQTPQFAAGGHHQQEHAGTRAQHPATDGTNDTIPLTGAGADLPRSIEPATDTRTSGVDVTV